MMADTAQLPKLSCSNEKTLRSIEGKTATKVRFVNQTNAVVKVYWINYSGTREAKFDLKPQESREQPTYLTHPWLVTDANGVCLGIFQPESQQKDATLYPPVPTTGEFQLPSNSDVGVAFTSKQTKDSSHKFTPSGTWNPQGGVGECTAEGYKYLPEEYKKDLKYPNNTPFCLVAVNKTTGSVTEVGTATTIVVKPGETLVFLVNDFPNHYTDNTGTLTVKWSAS